MNSRTGTLAASLLGATLIVTAMFNGADQVRAQTPAAGKQVSSQVVLQPVQSKLMHASVTAYGDVMAGAVFSISSASAARIAQLAVVQGQAVRKGQTLALLEPDPSVRLAYEQAQAALAQADADLQRTASMVQLKLATQGQLDAATRAKADAAANLAAQRALGGGAGGQALKSPVDGLVLALTSAQGERLQPGVSFMQIGSTETVKVLLGVDPAQLPALRKGLPVRVFPSAASSAAVNTSVADVQTMVDPKTQFANVLVKLPAAAHLLAGSRVRAEIDLESVKAFEVPRQAVLTDGKGAYVFQVSNNVARRVQVQQVVDNGRTVGITGEVDVARPVVVLGNYELSDGMQVRVSK